MFDSYKSLFSENDKIIHLIGIGGVSMCALAQVFNHRGFVVRGSDMQDSENTQKLTKLGVKVFMGHHGDNIGDADVVIRTSAVHDDNPEVIKAREKNIPVLERAQAWGILMEEYQDVICVSGTHGKTTTTSMITHVTLEARLNPQVMVGANLPIIGGGVRVANGNLFVAEACEYCNSFLNFNPTVAVISNIEEDHLDFFKDIDDIISSFRKFADKVPEERGIIAVNCDDANAMRAVEGLSKKIITFGVNESAAVRAVNIREENGGTLFDLKVDGEEMTQVSLLVHGLHNVYNALACAAACIAIGIPLKCIAAGLSKFSGVARRFEYKGQAMGAKVYDDYAHHPSEISATLNTVKALDFNRVICIFQPHTYTRTEALKDDFVEALGIADKVILTHIFAAREENIHGITSEVISDKIENAEYIESFDGVVARLKEIAQPGDLILTMGAGDGVRIGENFVKLFGSEN